MSYSIYYDRAFIRVGDKFIPMVNSGSNNCSEFWCGREVSEKNWGVLNWKRYGRVLFTADEVREIAKEYDQYNQDSGMLFKTRNQAFAPGEFERWVINGMKRAYTTEEYHAFGNTLYVRDDTPELNDCQEMSFSTTDELLSILDQLAGAKEISVRLGYSRGVYRPVNHRTRRQQLPASSLPEYYALKGVGTDGDITGLTIYFIRFNRKGGFKYFYRRDERVIKLFRTEQDAAQYIKKYGPRLSRFAIFEPERITRRAAA